MKRAASVLALLAVSTGASPVAARADTAYAPQPAAQVITAAPSHYQSTPGPYRADPVFSVTYTGSSRTDTTYRATPPRRSGKADHDTAHDTSHETWSLTGASTIAIPTCAATSDPCAVVTGTQTANGTSTATGTIKHVHDDGVSRKRDVSAKCTVTAHGVLTKAVPAPISVVYDAAQGAFVVQTGNPIGAALSALPSGCPGHPRTPGLLRNYFTPGFSLSSAYGPAVWFKSAAFVIPADVWHYSATIRVKPGLTATGRPPAKCGGTAVKYTRVCRTTGSWSGTLVFTAIGSVAGTATGSAPAAAPA